MYIRLIHENLKGFGLAALLAGLAVSGGAQTYTATDLGTVLPSSINSALQITGNNFATGDGFLYSNGSIIDIVGRLSGQGSQAASINVNAQITGASRATAANGGLPHTFLYSGGTMTDLGTLPGGSESQGNAINASGQIVGWSQTGSGKTHAFLYSKGAYTDLGPVPGASDSQATWV